MGKTALYLSSPAYIDLQVVDGCQNLMESYGVICVKCNKCGRFNKKEAEEEQ